MACGSCGKPVLWVFQGAVGAFLASTAPAASTGLSDFWSRAWRNDRAGGSRNDDRQAACPVLFPGMGNRESSATELAGHMGHPQLPADEGLPFVDPPE
jgi:hypothetical protein